MGLDMYLEKKTYVKNWDHTPEENKYEIDIKQGGLKVKHINTEKISEITEDIGYWRKANAIHNWFVNNIQEGNDNCKEYYVPKEKLKKLKEICEKVIESLEKKEINEDGIEIKPTTTFANTEIAKKLLPTTPGFFFGDTEYNEWYLSNLKETIKIINNALECEEEDIYYSSSW